MVMYCLAFTFILFTSGHCFRCDVECLGLLRLCCSTHSVVEIYIQAAVFCVCECIDM